MTKIKKRDKDVHFYLSDCICYYIFYMEDELAHEQLGKAQFLENKSRIVPSKLHCLGLASRKN